MKKAALVLFIVLSTTITAPSAFAGDWRFPVGMSYVSGFSDVQDLYESNLRREGYSVSSTDSVPIGLAVHPFYQFDFGLRLGMGLGPLMIILVGGDADSTFINVPLNVNIGYTILPSSSVSPFLRAGFLYHLAGGDYVEGSSPGLYTGGGVEFMRKKMIKMGVEVTYDNATIEFDRSRRSSNEEIEAGGIMVSAFAIF